MSASIHKFGTADRILPNSFLRPCTCTPHQCPIAKGVDPQLVQVAPKSDWHANCINVADHRERISGSQQVQDKGLVTLVEAAIL
eukprot:195063-Pleurochrysis_carterae.AAC.1